MIPRHLLEAWPEVLGIIRANATLFLLLDFDGTLTPIVERPEDADIALETRKLLEKLAEKPTCKLGIVSGRRLDDVRSRVGLEGIYYAGNHGLEMVGPGLNYRHQEAERLVDAIHSIAKKLQEDLNSIEGVIVEYKVLTLSVHYRLTPLEKIGVVEEKVFKEVSRWQKIEVSKGKKVLEVKPQVNWNKGKVAEFLIREVAPESLPIYIGDDKTDEDAFLQLKDGITVLVAETPTQTNAKYYLRNPKEVQDFIERLTSL